MSLRPQNWRFVQCGGSVKRTAYLNMVCVTTGYNILCYIIIKIKTTSHN